MRRGKTGGNRIALWIRRLAAVNAVSLVVIYLLAEFIAERTWLTTLFAYAPPLLYVLPTLPLALLALIWRDKVTFYLLAFTGVFGLFFILGFRLPLTLSPPNAALPADTLRVLAFNIQCGEAGIDRIAAVARQAAPDVISFEEIHGFGGGVDPLPGLERALPEYRFIRRADVAIASRLPIQSVRIHPLMSGEGYRVAVETTLLFRGRKVTVVGVHLATAATPESLSETPWRGVPGYLRRTAAVRRAQIATLETVLRPITAPLILCGDFNTPPRGVLYGRLTARYQDAFARRGVGFGWSFPTVLPLLRIDYVFTTNGAEAVNAFVVNARASDHLPFVADVALPQ